MSFLVTRDDHDVIDYFQQRTNILPGFLSPLSSKVQRVQRGPLQTGALQGDPTDSTGAVYLMIGVQVKLIISAKSTESLIIQDVENSKQVPL